MKQNEAKQKGADQVKQMELAFAFNSHFRLANLGRGISLIILFIVVKVECFNCAGSITDLSPPPSSPFGGRLSGVSSKRYEKLKETTNFGGHIGLFYALGARLGSERFVESFPAGINETRRHDMSLARSINIPPTDWVNFLDSPTRGSGHWNDDFRCSLHRGLSPFSLSWPLGFGCSHCLRSQLAIGWSQPLRRVVACNSSR